MGDGIEDVGGLVGKYKTRRWFLGDSNARGRKRPT
jgi:hypothetical protein